MNRDSALSLRKCRNWIFYVFAGVASVAIAPASQARDASTANAAIAHPTYRGFAIPPSKDEPKLNQDQSDAKYRTCASGWYSGPQPGKGWYTRDPYLWVVTPAFAKRMCMPPEFVHEGLKGAEAVAFRISRKTDEVNCGIGGNDQNCSGELVFRLELYMDSKIKLPKVHDGRYFQLASLPSAKLISRTLAELKSREKVHQSHPPDALTPVFKTGQVGVSGFKDGKVAWPIVGLFPETFFGQIFEGIDYYALEGSALKYFGNPRMKPLAITDFRIDIRPLNDKQRHTVEGMHETEFAHTIRLPWEFSRLMAEIDIRQGMDVPALIKEVLKK